MLRKELRELWKPALARFSLVPILMLLRALSYVIAGAKIFILFDQIFIITLAVTSIWIAHNLGITVLKSEYQDRALEYLLTFPFSKYKTLGLKLTARSLILLLPLGIYLLSAAILTNSPRIEVILDNFMFSPYFFPIWCFCILLNGFFCGLQEDRNWRAISGFITFLSIVLIPIGISSLFRIEAQAASEFHLVIIIFLGFCLVLLTHAVAFFPVFRRFDLRFSKKYSNIIRFMGLPILVLLDVVAIVILKSKML